MLRLPSSGSLWILVALIASLMVSGSAHAAAKYGDPEFQCVAAKQEDAGAYARSALRAWARWQRTQDDAELDAALASAAAVLDAAFQVAELASSAAGVDCVEQTSTAVDLAAKIEAAALAVASEINTGLDLGNQDDVRCGGRLLQAAADNILSLLVAESTHTETIPDGGSFGPRNRMQRRAKIQFFRAWARGECPTAASQQDVQDQLSALADSVVFHTMVSPLLDDSEFQAYSPVGPIDYEGATLNPRCGFDDDPDYHFFAKRGSVNKLVVYYQGGGACWDNLTCGVPVCKDGADPILDDPDNSSSGFADLSNPENPFKDWNVVFVTYCTCDVHFGDADQTYTGFFGPLNVSHRGFQNAKVVEKFARENFLSPETVFVTGSSAGGYGALFHGGLLHDVWSTAEFNVLGDASNGVITPSFLQNEFNNWNFSANLPPDIPGAVESITSGEGMPAYIEAVANYFPQTTWANYTTAYDGGTGGQTGFYNVMLNNSNAAAALTWWDASCAFNDVMTSQALDTFTRAPSNYRYYVDSGSRHTVYGSNTVYTGQPGGPPQTVNDWVQAMISFDPLESPSEDWTNADCALCEIVLTGNPRPASIPTPPFFNFGALTVINCP